MVPSRPGTVGLLPICSHGAVSDMGILSLPVSLETQMAAIQYLRSMRSGGSYGWLSLPVLCQLPQSRAGVIRHKPPSRHGHISGFKLRPAPLNLY